MLPQPCVVFQDQTKYGRGAVPGSSRAPRLPWIQRRSPGLTEPQSAANTPAFGPEAKVHYRASGLKRSCCPLGCPCSYVQLIGSRDRKGLRATSPLHARHTSVWFHPGQQEAGSSTLPFLLPRGSQTCPGPSFLRGPALYLAKPATLGSPGTQG